MYMFNLLDTDMGKMIQCCNLQELSMNTMNLVSGIISNVYLEYKYPRRFKYIILYSQLRINTYPGMRIDSC